VVSGEWLVIVEGADWDYKALPPFLSPSLSLFPPSPPMTHARQNLGRWGESVAATYLEAHGFALVARNWRCPYGEVDLVAQKEGCIHFVEVKTRRGRAHGLPEEALTPRKAAHLTAVAQTYLAEQGLEEADWQIDLIAVELDGQGKLLRCEHLPNVVQGGG
jgi:putative endonuclease